MSLRFRQPPKDGSGSHEPLAVLLEVEVRNPETNELDWQPIRMVIDTGAPHSVVPIERAKQFDIPFKRRPPDDTKVINTLGGPVTVHPGKIRLRIEGKEYEWDCHFAETPVPPRKEGNESATSKQYKRHKHHNKKKKQPNTVEDWGEMAEHGRKLRRILIGRAGLLHNFELEIQDKCVILRRKKGISWLFRKAIREIVDFLRTDS